MDEEKVYKEPVLNKRKGRPVKAITDLKKARANTGLPTPSLKELEIQSRLSGFLEEFLSNGGNATDAAMKAGNYKTRAQAAYHAREFYMKHLKDLGRIYLEAQGATMGKFLQVALDKMEVSKDPEWWDRLMKLAGYGDFLTKGGGGQGNNVTIIQTQDKLRNEFGFGEVETIEAEEVK